MPTTKDAVFLPHDGCLSGHQTVIRPLLMRVHWCAFVVFFRTVPNH